MRIVLAAITALSACLAGCATSPSPAAPIAGIPVLQQAYYDPATKDVFVQGGSGGKITHAGYIAAPALVAATAAPGTSGPTVAAGTCTTYTYQYCTAYWSSPSTIGQVCSAWGTATTTTCRP